MALRARSLFSLIAFLGGVLTSSASWSQAIGESALRASLQLSQTKECMSASAPLSVVGMPTIDASQSLSGDQVDRIHADFLTAFSAELPSCARLIDAQTAFGTVAFMTEVDSSGRLTEDQQNLIERRLQNAHSIFRLKIDRLKGQYKATVQLTAIESGQTISVAQYDLPEEQTSASCSDNTMSEEHGLSDLADDLLDGIHPIRGLHVATARFQDTDQAFGYGLYLTQQFLAALTQARNEQLFGTDFPIMLSEEAPGRGEDEYAVSLRYWICDDDKSARVVLSAVAPSGKTDVYMRNLSLELLPSGMTYKPALMQQAAQPAEPEGETEVPHQLTEPFLGLVSVSPTRLTTGDLLTISAEPPANCDPFFFDLAPGGRLTPLPLNIFDLTEIRPGLVRYDNDADSKYGITVQPEDERGTHRLGFICQPDAISNEEIRSVFRELKTSLNDTQAGVIEVQGARTSYNTSQYEITD
ncbi:MAG: hypothetical protein P1U53_01155 [Sulfitobacter sp.]|nr:hypothetical protein [Sulfitobacter sp.]